MYQWCNGLKLILHLYKTTRERTLSASGDFPGTNMFTLFYGLDRFNVYLVRFKLFFFSGPAPWPYFLCLQVLLALASLSFHLKTA